MKETTKQTISILSITILLGVSIFIFLKFTLPSFNNLVDLKTQIAEKQQIKAKLIQRKQTVLDIYNKYQTMGDDLNKIRLALPSDQQLAEVLSSLNMIADTSKITLNDISFRELAPVKTTSKTKTQVPYAIIEVTINAEGTFSNIKTFFQEIEREMRIMDVQQLSMRLVTTIMSQSSSSRTSKTSSKTTNYNIAPILKTNIILYTYYQP